MPGFSGTGPMGLGPMSGRAAGYCAGYPFPGFANPWPGRRFGRGRRLGRGVAGYGRPWFYGLAAPPFYGPAEADEKAVLKQQVRSLREQLRLLEGRLKDMPDPPQDE